MSAIYIPFKGGKDKLFMILRGATVWIMGASAEQPYESGCSSEAFHCDAQGLFCCFLSPTALVVPTP